MGSEWNLSDKVCPACKGYHYHIEDVREFVKRLKESLSPYDEYNKFDIVSHIDTLAGEKLC